MTREQAYEAMKNGKKVTHQGWSDRDCIFLEDGKVMLQDYVDISESWEKYLRDYHDEKAWSIYHEPVKMKCTNETCLDGLNRDTISFFDEACQTCNGTGYIDEPEKTFTLSEVADILKWVGENTSAYVTLHGAIWEDKKGINYNVNEIINEYLNQAK